MKYIFFILFIANFTFATEKLVQWDSEEGQKRFSSAEFKADFFKLANNFVAQDNKIFCGLASSTIILNSLRLGSDKKIPTDSNSISSNEKKYIPKKFDPFFKRYTQSNIISENSSFSKTRAEILGKPVKINGKEKKDFGLQLHQLAALLKSHNLNVKTIHVDDKLNKENALNEIKANLKTKNDYVLVNYSRKILGQAGGGHISPIAAYDQVSNSFLIMDVNPNKAPWVWVSSDLLFKSMKTFDTVKNRGYLLIKE